MRLHLRPDTMPCYYGLGINTIITQQQLHHRREEQFQKRGHCAAFRGLYFYIKLRPKIYFILIFVSQYT